MRLELFVGEVENGYLVEHVNLSTRKKYVATSIESLAEVIVELATEASQTEDVKQFRETGI